MESKVPAFGLSDKIELVVWIIKWVLVSDESEPSWLEPWLKLRDFRLGSARLGLWPQLLHRVKVQPQILPDKEAELVQKTLYVY